MPREGHDIPRSLSGLGIEEFLSTCPVRGTTLTIRLGFHLLSIFLSTCPVRGTTWPDKPNLNSKPAISIHVPREGHDLRAR